jgi:hypothetical protein
MVQYTKGRKSWTGQITGALKGAGQEKPGKKENKYPWPPGTAIFFAGLPRSRFLKKN